MVEVKLFAMLKELAGTGVLTLPLSGHGRVSDIVARLIEEHPDLEGVFAGRRVLVAVNQRYAGMETELSEGDEVAFLPPVSGG